MRGGGRADRRRRALHVLLPLLPAAAASQAATATGPCEGGHVSADGAVEPPEGFSIGHWTDEGRRTGCTVVLTPPATRGGVDVRGGGPGTRETDVIGPFAGAHEVSGVALCGGSAFGLAAADGVVRWLEEQGRGYRTPAGVVPIVPAAVVYDLAEGDPKARPDAAAGYAACEAAQPGLPQRGR